MFCGQCGKQIPESSKFCPYCAASQAVAPAAATPDLPPDDASSTTPQPPAPEPLTADTPEPQAQSPVAGTYPPPAPQPDGTYQPQGQPPAAGAYQPPTSQPWAPQLQPDGTYQPQGQQPAAGAYQPQGQPPMGFAPQAAPVKKKSKLPLIIVLAVVAILVIGGGLALALGIIPNLFKSVSAAAVYSEGMENLTYNTSSATVNLTYSVEAKAQGSSSSFDSSMTLSWEYGKDLRSSIVWGEMEYPQELLGGSSSADIVGFLLKDDTLYYYERSGNDIDILFTENNVVSQMNDGLADAYGVDVDLNNLVKNGKIDKTYVEKLNTQISEAAISEYGYEIDTDMTGELLYDFLITETGRKNVSSQFMSEVEKSSNGDVTTYSFSCNPLGFFQALSDYAEERSKDSKYAEAADLIIEANDTLQGLNLNSYIGEVAVDFSIQDKTLIGISIATDIAVDSQTGSFAAKIAITDINATDLANNATISWIQLTAAV